MKNINSPSILAVFSVLMIILLVPVSGCTDDDNEAQNNITIVSENTCWSPIMSSIVGIDLTGKNCGEGDLMYHWTATGDGSSDVMFISWGNETEFQVLESGNKTQSKEGETIWWSYWGIEIESMPEKFTVLVSAVDKDTNETVFEKEIYIKRKVMMFCIEGS